jgi:hypothetical protein
MCYRKKVFFALALIPLVGLACSTSLFGSNPTAAPSSTPSPTITLTATASRTPTQTSTVTLIPTATLVPFEESVQPDGILAVTNQVQGYKFLLAKGWKVMEAWGRYDFVADYTYAKGRTITLGIFTRAKEADLELELLNRTNQQVGTLDALLAKGIVTNGCGTPLGYLKTAQRITGLLRAKYYHEYDILFLADDTLVDFNFYVTAVSRTEFDAADMQKIQAVQNSIQIN